MQWNILADALAFNSFDRVPDDLLHWNVRLPLIAHHIHDHKPDIICLQECDKFDDILQALGEKYDGVFAPKKDQLIGNAIYWNKSSGVERISELKSVNFKTPEGKDES